MRKIEKDMLAAIRDPEFRNWQSGNTMVTFWNDGDPAVTHTRALVCLHGNHIANVWLDGKSKPDANFDTFARWPTRTTVSRLRALGINASVRKGVPMIDGKPV